jgi:hypothetical protein
LPELVARYGVTKEDMSFVVLDFDISEKIGVVNDALSCYIG